MRFATKSGIQVVPHSVPNWRELVRNLVPRLVPNLVIDLVPDLVSDEMPNLILVVPDLVSQIWYYYQICPTDLVLDRVPPAIRSRTSAGIRKRTDLVPDLRPNLLLERLPDLVPCLVHTR